MSTAGTPVALYCNYTNSEVSDEHDTLTEALVANPDPRPGWALISNGVTLATSFADRWLLDSTAISRLRDEVVAAAVKGSSL